MEIGSSASEALRARAWIAAAPADDGPDKGSGSPRGTQNVKKTFLAIGYVTAALTAAAASAQSTSGPTGVVGLEEVVVTAQRRTESAQDVPIGISTFSSVDLERQDITRALQVAQLVPNLMAMNNVGLGSAATYFLRGQGTTESLATQDPPVGTYIDNIYISRQTANNLAFLDVERVEVLRGPQGTLFGRNTTGGAIRTIMKRPGTELGGYLEASTGSWSALGLSGSIDVPVSDRVLTKFTAFYRENDGYVDNITTGETLNGEESFGVRAAMTAALTDSVDWDLSVLYTDVEDTNILNFDCDPSNPSRCGSRYVSTGLVNRNGGQSQFGSVVIANGKDRIPLGAETKVTLVESNFQFPIAGAGIEFITGYVKTEQDYMLDFFDGRQAPAFGFADDPVSGLPTTYNVANNIILDRPVLGLTSGGFVLANIAESKQFTQEIKATGNLWDDRVSYVAGLYYYNEKNDSDFADIFTLPTGTILLLADRIVQNDTEAWAGYAQFDFALTDRSKFTAGVRYTDETKDFAFSDNRPQCQVSPLPATCLDSANFVNVDIDQNPATPGVDIPLSQKTRLWTPRIALDYAPSDDMLLFASATRGFKSGSMGARATSVRLLLPFDPEKVWSYEVGAKTEWFDRRLRLNVTGFLQETDGFQGGTASVSPTGALSFVTGNLADMENTGIEIELQALVGDALRLNMSLGYQDIKYKIDRNAPNVDSYNRRSVNAQQAECLAALSGAASPLGDARTPLARAGSNCTNGLVRTDGSISTPVRSPELTLAVGGSYELRLGEWRLTPALNVLYTADSEVGTANLSAWENSAGVLNLGRDGAFRLGSFSESHTLLNASLTLASPGGAWQAALSCDNCSDESFPQSTLSNYTYINPPRRWALRLKYRF